MALSAAAADFPKATGYVNDFAHRLTETDRAALQQQFREYERATSNEVVIAIVNSLDGEPVDQYANGLFRAWGIGKKDRNNGVLFLWAVKERKLRIQTGMGLEQVLPDSATAEILATVSALFRREDYSGGVHAAVDAILAKLGGSAPPAATEVAPDAPSPPPEPKNDALLLIPLAGIAGLIAVIIALVRRSRKRELTQSLPRDLDRASAALGEADGLARSAATAIDALRKEAPAAVWSEYADAVSGAPATLSTLRADAAAIRAMPRETLGELSHAHHALEHWNTRFSQQWEWLAGAQARLDSFRYCREQSQIMLPNLRQSLEARRSAGRNVDAATETYQQAVAAAATPPVNWLLVHDLLTDVQDCLAYDDDPDRFRHTRRPRNWGDDGNSTALLYLMMMQTQQQSSWGNSGMDVSGGGSVDSGGGSFDSGGGGGGGDSGSFGGGDTGGGGSSSDY